jgi:hypothetical protein
MRPRRAARSSGETSRRDPRCSTRRPLLLEQTQLQSRVAAWPRGLPEGPARPAAPAPAGRSRRCGDATTPMHADAPRLGLLRKPRLRLDRLDECEWHLAAHAADSEHHEVTGLDAIEPADDAFATGGKVADRDGYLHALARLHIGSSPLRDRRGSTLAHVLAPVFAVPSKRATVLRLRGIPFHSHPQRPGASTVVGVARPRRRSVIAPAHSGASLASSISRQPGFPHHRQLAPSRHPDGVRRVLRMWPHLRHATKKLSACCASRSNITPSISGAGHRVNFAPSSQRKLRASQMSPMRGI